MKPLALRAVLMSGAGTAALGLLVSGAIWTWRPDMVFGAGFLFGDESSLLLVADALQAGRLLYREIAYPYGPLPVWIFQRAAAIFGNTPATYVALLIVLASASMGLAAALVRRAASAGLLAAVAAVAWIATMPIPGAPVGGYLSSPYIPLERICILIAALLWREPASRPAGRSLAIGALLGICQGVRFGSGVVALAAVLVVDLLSRSRSRVTGAGSRAPGPQALVIAAFAAIEFGWMSWAWLAIGPPEGTEFLWPLQLLETHRASGAARWPTWGGWPMFATQYAMPLVAATLTAGSLAKWMRRSPADDPVEAEGALYLPFVFYLIAAIVYFRHEHHFRQFAWMLTVGAVPLVASLTLRARFAIAALCAPALWPLASALLHDGPATAGLDVPAGYLLHVDDATRERVAFLEREVADVRGAILFMPHGSGWLYGYRHSLATRHPWFYSSAVVRPFERDRFLDGIRRADRIIDCRPSEALTSMPVPEEARAVVAEQFRESARESGCRSYSPR